MATNRQRVRGMRIASSDINRRSVNAVASRDADGLAAVPAQCRNLRPFITILGHTMELNRMDALKCERLNMKIEWR